MTKKTQKKKTKKKKKKKGSIKLGPPGESCPEGGPAGFPGKKNGVSEEGIVKLSEKV